MGTLTNFPQGFAAGLTLRGLPILQSQPGKVFWLYNGTPVEPGEVSGADGNPGTFQKPFASLSAALTHCTAGKGDIIMVKPGHAEKISSATALNMNVADVAVIGLGGGSSRPSFTLDTANTATITVSANNVSFQNCVFIANFLNIAVLFTLTTAKHFAVDNCSIRDTSASLNFLNICTTDATSNHADGLSITNNEIILLATSGVVNLLSAAGTNDRVAITDNYYQSATTNAGAVIPIAAGKILTGFRLLRNRFNLVNAAATATAYLITTNGSTNTGFIDGNIDHCLSNTTYLSSLLVTASSGFVFGQNWHSRTADKSPGVVLPAADS